ncbi:hypothetical protein DsansV1_C19g0160211 [Dioscorea sansibarensis]
MGGWEGFVFYHILPYFIILYKTSKNSPSNKTSQLYFLSFFIHGMKTLVFHLLSLEELAWNQKDCFGEKNQVALQCYDVWRACT